MNSCDCVSYYLRVFEWWYPGLTLNLLLPKWQMLVYYIETFSSMLTSLPAGFSPAILSKIQVIIYDSDCANGNKLHVCRVFSQPRDSREHGGARWGHRCHTEPSQLHLPTHTGTLLQPADMLFNFFFLSQIHTLTDSCLTLFFFYNTFLTLYLYLVTFVHLIYGQKEKI